MLIGSSGLSREICRGACKLVRILKKENDTLKISNMSEHPCRHDRSLEPVIVVFFSRYFLQQAFPFVQVWFLMQ